MNNKIHFLNLDKKTANDRTAPYAVLQIPYERTVCYGKGTERGPSSIVQASNVIENFDEELLLPLDLKVQTVEPLVFDSLSDQESMKLIKKSSVKILQDNRFVMALGGEHTISAPLVEAAAEHHDSIAVLQLDAHLDLYSKFTDTPLSHACVMRRIREMGIPVVHAGIRNISSEEFDFVMTDGVKYFQAREMLPHKKEAWVAEIISLLPKNVYLSVDVDVFDPALVPGTGTPEPGGLQWYDLLYLVRTLAREKNIVSADIVETMPIPGSNVSEYTAARLAVKTMLYHKHRSLL